jgi:hypothetical protein
VGIRNATQTQKQEYHDRTMQIRIQLDWVHAADRKMQGKFVTLHGLSQRAVIMRTNKIPAHGFVCIKYIVCGRLIEHEVIVLFRFQ